MIEENVPNHIKQFESKHYFTQLALITDYFYVKLQQNFFSIDCKISYPHINQEQDVSTLNITIQKSKVQIHFRIIQMQNIVKFHIVFKQGANDEQIYSYYDEFWILCKNYLPTKMNQSYKIQDFQSTFNKQKTKKLQTIINERVFHQITKMISQNYLQPLKAKSQHEISDQFIIAINKNIILISRYLKQKQYNKLQRCNRILYKILHTQSNYKAMFETKWGRTGFSLQQKDWIKMYKNKAIQMSKKKNTSYKGFLILPPFI